MLMILSVLLHGLSMVLITSNYWLVVSTPLKKNMNINWDDEIPNKGNHQPDYIRLHQITSDYHHAEDPSAGAIQKTA